MFKWLIKLLTVPNKLLNEPKDYIYGEESLDLKSEMIELRIEHLRLQKNYLTSKSKEARALLTESMIEIEEQHEVLSRKYFNKSLDV